AVAGRESRQFDYNPPAIFRHTIFRVSCRFFRILPVFLAGEARALLLVCSKWLVPLLDSNRRTLTLDWCGESEVHSTIRFMEAIGTAALRG
ncbi:MAG: hypothetical protein ACYCOX_15960, partial [Acidobacteriaceae bacterium]